MRLTSIAILTLGLLAAFSGCSSGGGNSNVVVTVNKITLGEISPTQGNIDVSIQISNNNSIEALVETIVYDIHFGHEGKWILLGQGGRVSTKIEGEAVADFTTTTVVEDNHLVSTLLENILGAQPTQIKVTGNAELLVGEESFEVHFEKVDNDPYDSPKETTEDSLSASENGNGE